MTDEQLQELANKTEYSFEDLKMLHDHLKPEKRNETDILHSAKGATSHIKKLRKKKITNIAEYLTMINGLPAELDRLIEKYTEL